MGAVYFKNLSSPQVTFLGAVFSGVLPYALGKLNKTV